MHSDSELYLAGASLVDVGLSKAFDRDWQPLLAAAAVLSVMIGGIGSTVTIEARPEPLLELETYKPYKPTNGKRKRNPDRWK